MLSRRLLAKPCCRHLLLRRHASASLTSHPPAGQPLQLRFSSNDSDSCETGENSSGHITTTQNESILFFNNLQPHGLQWTARVASALHNWSSILQGKLKTGEAGPVIPSKVVEDVSKEGKLGRLDVIEVLSRLKEGGAFLKFRHDPSIDAKSVEAAVQAHLEENAIRPWWSPFDRLHARLVLGKPWIEDLFRLPSPRLRVEFLPTEPGGEYADLSQEQLYAFFRPYGKLWEITKQPTDSKILPRYAFLDFSHIRKATMAKNCLHGYTVSHAEGGGKLGTVFRITYEKKDRFGWIKDWMFNHPRIAIPVLAALVAAISIAVFDPLRRLSVRAHITRAFHLEENAIFSWALRRSEDLINRVRIFGRPGGNPEAGMEVVWENRKEDIKQIQSWLMEAADTFIVVMGPRGSGKKELVIDHALRHKREAHRVLVIDCKPVQEARGEAATIAAAAQQVGYRPVFSWVNNISGLIDLAAQGMTGVKAGFSETLDTQLSKICNTTSAALQDLALEERKKSDKDSNLSDSEYLEAHPELRPVLVIDNFLHKSNEPGTQIVYDKVAEWAAQLTTSSIAHVIFLTHDISFSKSLSKALPDRVFRQIALGDCSPEVAKRYVINHLDFDSDPGKVVKTEEGDEPVSLTPSQKRADLRELDDVIPLLGGRLTDLEFLARRIKAGETPSEAVREVIEQSASEILKMFLFPGEAREWSSQQAWTLVRRLSASDTLRYNEVLMTDVFKSGGEKAMAALEQAELISVQSLNGRPYSVKPGKPVYQSAFQRLVEDRVLAAKMDLEILGDAITTENKSIDKFEQELKLLAQLPKQPGELYPRTQWLLNKIAGSQNKIEGLEKESGSLKQILAKEY